MAARKVVSLAHIKKDDKPAPVVQKKRIAHHGGKVSPAHDGQPPPSEAMAVACGHSAVCCAPLPCECFVITCCHGGQVTTNKPHALLKFLAKKKAAGEPLSKDQCAPHSPTLHVRISTCSISSVLGSPSGTECCWGVR